MLLSMMWCFFQAEDGIRDLVRSRGLGDVYKRQVPTLLVDAGDVFQGTLYFNQFNGMADLEFYNAMGLSLIHI